MYLSVPSETDPLKSYIVELSYKAGHLCECKSHLHKGIRLSKQGIKRNPLNVDHWCKHVQKLLDHPNLVFGDVPMYTEENFPF